MAGRPLENSKGRKELGERPSKHGELPAARLLSAFRSEQTDKPGRLLSKLQISAKVALGT